MFQEDVRVVIAIHVREKNKVFARSFSNLSIFGVAFSAPFVLFAS